MNVRAFRQKSETLRVVSVPTVRTDIAVTLQTPQAPVLLRLPTIMLNPVIGPSRMLRVQK